MIPTAQVASSGPSAISTPMSAVMPDVDAALAGLLLNLGAIPSLERVGFRTHDGRSEIWVMLSPWSLEDEEQVFRLDLDYRREGGRVDLDLRVVALDRSGLDVVPAVDLLIERKKG